MSLTKLPFVIFVIFLIGFFVVVGTQSYQQQNRAHDHYKPADATITWSEISCGTSRNSRCHVFIQYTYAVQGTPYTGGRLAYISNSDSDTKQLSRYPLGARVTAYFDPDKPREAVLDNSAWPIGKMAGMIAPPLIIMIVICTLWRVIIKRLGRRLLARDRYP